MGTLAGADHRYCGRIIQLPNRIGKGARGIDDRAGFCGMAKIGFEIDKIESVDQSIGIVRDRNDLRVVQQCCAVLIGGAGEGNQQAGVVELPVVVENSTAQIFLLNGRNLTDDLLAGKVL